MTLLVSSHVMDEASRCDRLILMRDGRVLSNSTVPELGIHRHCRRRSRIPHADRSDGGVSLKRTLATAERVLAWLRGDHRTVALMLVVPVVLMALLKWVYYDNDAVFNSIGLPLLGIFRSSRCSW